MSLPYDDYESGRDYNAGSLLSIKTGAIFNVESGGQFQIGGTQITSNASELNSLDGVNTGWPALLPDPTGPTFNIGAEAANVINVACQLKDATGTNMAASKVVEVYLSDSATGDGIATTAPDGDIAIGTDGTILYEPVTDKVFRIWTESDGSFDVDIGEAAAATWYMAVVYGNNLYMSGAITFA